MFSFCFRRSCFERIAMTLQKVYSYCHSNKFSLHTIQISIQWDMIFWEKSQFADFMSSLFCSYGSGVVSKSYSKIKFTVRYVVPLCAIFVLFFIHALQPTLWSIKHEGVRPWKMGASLLNASAPKTMVPNSRFQHSSLSASTNPKAPSWKTRTHMADGECCWMSMFFVASEPWRTAVENLHSCRRNSFRMT